MYPIITRNGVVRLLKGLFVPLKGKAETREFDDIHEIAKVLGIPENGHFTTLELEDIEGIGIIAHDQDKKGLKKNRLGIKGDFFVIGMKRDISPNMENLHIFRSLTDDEDTDIRVSLAIATYRQMTGMK